MKSATGIIVTTGLIADMEKKGATKEELERVIKCAVGGTRTGKIDLSPVSDLIEKYMEV